MGERLPRIDQATNVLMLLKLEELGGDVFRSRYAQPNVRRGLFGGQIVAQALAAADRTVAGRSVHSLHSYFLRAGITTEPVTYRVERTRDGGRFSTRRVVAEQRGHAIFILQCSYRTPIPGVSHQRMTEIPLVPEEALDTDAFVNRVAETHPHLRAFMRQYSALDIRVPSLAGFTEVKEKAERHYWLRARGVEGIEDPAVHRQTLAFMSDFLFAGTPLARHSVALPRPDLFVASLDHCLWFHRDMRCDDWLLFEAESPSAENAVNLARGLIYDRAGRLVASMVQEALQYELEAQPAAETQDHKTRGSVS